MKKALLASAACAALGLAASAQAAVVSSYIEKMAAPPGVNNGTAFAATYHSGILHLHSDSGNITAIDFSGARGFNGPMVQRWTSSGGDGTYDTPTPGPSTVAGSGTSAVNFDSHFLGLASNIVVGSALTETGVIPPSGSSFPGGFPANTDSGGIGQGTSLKGAYGIVGAVQSTDLDVAYIVNKDAVPFTAQVATANGTFDITGTIPAAVAVPEPTTLSLAGLGVLGLVARRRRA